MGSECPTVLDVRENPPYFVPSWMSERIHLTLYKVIPLIVSLPYVPPRKLSTFLQLFFFFFSFFCSPQILTCGWRRFRIPTLYILTWSPLFAVIKSNKMLSYSTGCQIDTWWIFFLFGFKSPFLSPLISLSCLVFWITRFSLYCVLLFLMIFLFV